MKNKGRVVVGALLAGLLLSHAQTAVAADCSALRAEVARLSSSGSGAKWQDARQRQATALQAARRDASYFRCDVMRNNPKCIGLNDQIRRMDKNLRAIEKKLTRVQGSSSSSRRLRDLQQRLASPECQEPQREARGNGGFIKKIFGSANVQKSVTFEQERSRARLVAANPGNTQSYTGATGRQAGGQSRVRLPISGTYRTLCVRTCDGYFFPVSFSTSQDQFALDSQRCGEICPAAETQLYVYRNPGGTPEDMTSLAGIPYDELPNAWRYKSERVGNCSCRSTQSSRVGSLSDRVKLLTRSDETRSLEYQALDVPPPVQPGMEEMSIDGVSGEFNVSSLENDAAPAINRNPLVRKDSPLAQPRMSADQIPDTTDPVSRLNLELGYNVTASVKSITINREPVAKSDKRLSLPTLGGSRDIATGNVQDSASGEGESQRALADINGPDPIFGKRTENLSPRPAEGDIRVVGPEYFVAQ